jgi:hypothetical protein
VRSDTIGGGNVEKKKYDVLTAKVKNEKCYWTVLGVAYENETNIKIEFNALPIANPNGDIFVYLKEQSNVQKADVSDKKP